ncbi:MAG: hypothetical protein ACYCUV_08910 [Phycisphaerae bacterium]
MTEPLTSNRSTPPALGRKSHPVRVLLASLLILASLLATGVWIAAPRILNSATVQGYVLDKIQSRLGLRMDVKTMHIGLTGKTTLTDVRIGLPLRHWPFARIPTLTITHNAIAWLLLTGKLGITNISAASPRVILHRGDEGQWNLPAAWQDIRLAWQNWKLRHPGHDLASAGLPQVEIHHGTLLIELSRQTEMAIDNIEFKGIPTSALTWRFSLKAASTQVPQSHLLAKGVLVPGQSWLHSIHVQATGLGPWLKRVWPSWNGAASVSAQLRGRLLHNTLSERLNDVRINLGQFGLHGNAQAQYAGDHWQINPENVGIRVGYLSVPVNIYRGQIWADSRGFHVKGIRADLAGGGLHLSGVMNPAEQSASVTAAWHGISMLGTEMQSGTLTGSLSSPWPGKRIIGLHITSSGQCSYGSWNTAATLSAQGRFHGKMNWQLESPEISWQRTRLVTLKGLRARGAFDKNQITVAYCTLASDPYLNLNGLYNLTLGLWRLHLRATAASIPLLKLPANVHVHVSAYGNSGGMQLENLLVKSPVWSLAASGNCIFTGRYPTHLIVTVTGIPLINHGAKSNAGWALGGLISGKLLADGGVMPLALHLDGRLAGTHFTVNHHLLALPEVHVVGQLTKNKIVLAADPVTVLGGKIAVRFDANTSGRLAGLTLQSQHISAAAVARMLLPTPPVGLHGYVGMNLKISVPGRDLQMTQVQGQISADNLVIPSPKALTAPINILHGTATLKYNNGILTLAPIKLVGIGANASASANWNQLNPADIYFKLHLSDWPANIPALQFDTQVSGTLAGRYNWHSTAIHGTGDLNATVFQHLLPIGLASTHIIAVGRIISLNNTSLDLMGNTLTGQGIWNIDQPLKSSAVFQCHLPNPKPLLLGYSWADGLKGTFAGNIVLGPATGKHPLAPLELQFDLDAKKARLGAIELGSLNVHAFISDHAILLDRSKLAFAGGTMRLWARVSRHQAGLLSSDTSLTFDNINLDELTRTVITKASPTPGLLSGHLTAVALSNNWHNAIGSGELKITQSNLAGSTIMASIYRLMNVRLKANHPTGTGEARWRIDGGNAQITYLHYFDRGVEILGAGELDNIWKLPDSTLKGYVIGTVRPFKNLHIPFIPQAKAILNALESSVSSVQVAGTWAHPTTTPVVFKNLGTAIQEIFVNAIVGNQSNSSGQ